MKRFFPALVFLYWLSLLFSCSNSDFSRAERIYEANPTMYKRAVQEPELRQAVSYLKNGLSHGSEDPAAEVLLWKCLIKLRDMEKNIQRAKLVKRGSEIHAEIIHALADPEESVRQEAASLIGDMHVSQATSDLINLLKNDEFYDVQKAAAYALMQLRSEAAIEPLLEKLVSKNDRVRYYAARALGSFGTPEVSAALLARIKSPDETIDVRHQAAISLGKICDKNHISELGKIFDDRSKKTDTRILAASTLASLGDDRGYEYIVQIAKRSDNSFFRGLAITALGQFNRPEALRVLRDTAKYGNKALRVRAADALGEIGTPEAIELLKNLLEDSNLAVQQSAREALESLESKAN
ncbi:HEAT repeat domain-containing protein [candidate division KSB1 bacterium]|nr:HEAT repeat domain-containing protein [candidate division KSB1 bacterium]